uniref:Uncharacterized protein n=1 Tax=viral metagenome TaxID=1070528 RepID=A0A6C0ECV7_9ZZZZ
MSYLEPYKISDIDLNKIVYSKIKETKNKKIVIIKYNDNNKFNEFVFQLPTLLNINKAELFNEYSEIELALIGKNYSKINDVINFFNNLELKIKDDAHNNAHTWFKNNNDIINFQKIIRNQDSKFDNDESIGEVQESNLDGVGTTHKSSGNADSVGTTYKSSGNADSVGTTYKSSGNADSVGTTSKSSSNADSVGTIKLKLIKTHDFESIIQLNNKRIDAANIPEDSWCKMILECYAIWINSNNDFGIFLRPIIVSFTPKEKINYKYKFTDDSDNGSEFEIPDTDINDNIFMKINTNSNNQLDETTQIDYKELMNHLENNNNKISLNSIIDNLSDSSQNNLSDNSDNLNDTSS